jgi:hypothetical protein
MESPEGLLEYEFGVRRCQGNVNLAATLASLERPVLRMVQYGHFPHFPPSSFSEVDNMERNTRILAGLLGATLCLFAATAFAQDINSLSAAERASGWRLLFDGTSTAGWRGYRSETVPESWRVENGSLLARREQGKSAGDIITVDQFGDFELILEWKMTRGNNSGVIYRATEQHDQVWQSGPEYQILDNTTHLDGLNVLASAGACYAVFAPAKDATRPVGQWN